MLDARFRRVPVIRVARQGLGCDQKAFFVGRDDTDLYAKLVLPVNHVLGDAFNLRGMHAVQFGRITFSALSVLAVNTPRHLQQALKVLLQRLPALGLAIDFTDDSSGESA